MTSTQWTLMARRIPTSSSSSGARRSRIKIITCQSSSIPCSESKLRDLILSWLFLVDKISITILIFRCFEFEACFPQDSLLTIQVSELEVNPHLNGYSAYVREMFKFYLIGIAFQHLSTIQYRGWFPDYFLGL